MRNAAILTQELGDTSHISLSVNACASEKKDVISPGQLKPGIDVVLAGVGVPELADAGTLP